ncbi:MAG: SatD family protein [Gemmatimonadota bacterium]
MPAPTAPLGAPVFFALIGDIVGSRDLPDRAVFQRELRDLVDELNAELEAEAIAAPLKLTAGDEIQALLARPDAAVDILVRIADRLHPASIVWGLGRGALATDLDPDVSALDGPCFHRARDALGAAARDGAWLRLEGFARPHDAALAALFRLMGGIRARWTEVQARYVRAVRTRLQREVAEQLGVSEPAVSKALASAQFTTVEEGERAARALLRWLGEAPGIEA